MKFFTLCLFLLPFVISCSSSSDSEAIVEDGSAYRIVDLKIDEAARNAANPFDDAGQIHNELLYSYYYGDYIPMTFSGIVTTTTEHANSNASFVELTKGVPYSFTAEDRVLYILSHLDSCMPEIIEASLESTAAKSSLSDFVSSLLTLCEREDDYVLIYNFITAYEGVVLKNAQFTAKEKRVILTTTSIARHSAYARKKRPKKNKDPEWQYMVGNIAAAIEGSVNSMEDAVMKGVVTGIVENSK